MTGSPRDGPRPRLALIETTGAENREALAVALTRPILAARPLDLDAFFTAVKFGPWLPIDEAARILRRTLDALMHAPSLPDLLRDDGFGHDLAHLLPLIARVAGAEAVVRVAREVESSADILR